MIGLSQPSLAENSTQPLWMGLFNSDHSLLQINCTILTYKPMYYQFYGTNSLPVALYENFTEQRDKFVLTIQKAGFNALVDYRENWFGGSGGLEYIEYGTTQRNVLISGVGSLSGTALKLDCK
ncbi:MAG: hypothetical protein P1U57_00365 [Oleibacter sp.]|nr:hypothetical protein [Thalassolituus sp.]